MGIEIADISVCVVKQGSFRNAFSKMPSKFPRPRPALRPRLIDRFGALFLGAIGLAWCRVKSEKSDVPSFWRGIASRLKTP